MSKKSKNEIEKIKQEIKEAEYKRLPLNQILDDPMNPNVMTKEQLTALEFSIKKEKFVVPLVVNKVKKMEKPYMVVNGHQRLKILRKYGVLEILCAIIEKPLEEARIFGLGLNRNVGEDDPRKLSNLFHQAFTHQQINLITKFTPNFDQDFVKLTIDKFHHTSLESSLVEEEIPELPTSTKTKTGDIYQLGKHRIMCGDCTKAQDVNKLLDKVKINQINTDPPYGVDYQGKNSFLHKVRPKSKRIQFEGEKKGLIEDYREFFKKFLELVPMADYNTIYVFMAGLRLHELRMAFGDAGVTWGDNLVWLKNHFVMGRKDHKAKHEFIVYGWKGRHKFYGEYATTTVYEENKPQVSEKHPTMKPVPLVARLILEGTRKHDIVYEPFCGSGTCIIACETNDRICYAMELVPHYIDVAVQRWENLTSKKGVKL